MISLSDLIAKLFSSFYNDSENAANENIKQLAQYIITELNAGYSIESISYAILRQGYNIDDLTKALDIIGKEKNKINTNKSDKNIQKDKENIKLHEKLGKPKLQKDKPYMIYLYIFGIILIILISFTVIFFQITKESLNTVGKIHNQKEVIANNNENNESILMIKGYNYYKEKFNKINEIKLSYSIKSGLIHDPPKIIIIKKDNVTYTKVAFSLLNTPIIQRNYQLNDLVISCIKDNCNIGNAQTFIPELITKSKEMIYLGSSSYNNERCEKFSLTADYATELPLFKLSDDNITWKYLLCINPNYGFEYYINIALLNTTGQVLNYSIVLDNYSLTDIETITLPEFIITNASCHNNYANITIMTFNNYKKLPLTIGLRRNNFLLDESVVILENISAYKPVTANTVFSNTLTPGITAYELKTCHSENCTSTRCILK